MPPAPDQLSCHWILTRAAIILLNPPPQKKTKFARKGQSIENVRQGAGRATFVGLEVLQNNTKRNYIMTAMTKEDYDVVQMHDTVAREAMEHIEAGQEHQNAIW